MYGVVTNVITQHPTPSPSAAAVLLRCHAAVLTRHRAAPLASPLLRCYAALMQCVRACVRAAPMPAVLPR